MKNSILAWVLVVLFAVAAMGQATPVSSTAQQAQTAPAPQKKMSHAKTAKVHHAKSHHKSHKKHHKAA